MLRFLSWFLVDSRDLFPPFFVVASGTLGQSYDRACVREVILNNGSKVDHYQTTAGPPFTDMN